MKEESDIPRQQTKGRGSNPRSLQNLKPFQKGESGNPGGLPKGTPKVSIALMKLLAARPDDDFKPATRAEQIALALCQKASSGDVSAIRELSDRTEGKSPAKINLNKGDGHMERYRQLALDMAAKYDKPLDEVVADIIEREPDTAQYFDGWLM